MIDNTKYAYSVGRIRVAENFMIDEVKLLRLVDAPDLKEAQKIIVECKYKEEDDYMQMLNNEHASSLPETWHSISLSRQNPHSSGSNSSS